MFETTEVYNLGQAKESYFDTKLSRRNIYGMIFSSKTGRKIRHLVEGITVFEVNKNLVLSTQNYNKLLKCSRRGNFAEYEMYLLTMNMYYRYGEEKASSILMYLSKLSTMKWKYRREAIISLAFFQFISAFELDQANRIKLFAQVAKTLGAIDLREEDDLVLSIYGFSLVFAGDYKKGKKFLEKVEIKNKVHYKFLELLG